MFYDVIVAGLGTAGTIAAVAAARQGARVLAVERLNFPGGTYTGGYVHGCYGNPATGLLRELSGGLPPGFDPVEGQKFRFDRELRRLGVVTVYGALATQVEMTGSVVTGIRYLERGAEKRADATTVIDATAEGDLCRAAGCAMRCGRELDGLCQPWTASMARRFGGTPDQLFVANFDAGRIDRRDPDEFAAALLAGHQLHIADDYRNSAGLMVQLSELPGIREGAHIIGRVPLTIDDLFAGKVSGAEAVAWVRSNIDAHTRDLALESATLRAWMTGASLWGEELWIPVPFRTLVPREVGGLLAAGRHFGVDHDLGHALRMNALMGQLGEAAGVMAATAARRKIAAEQLKFADFSAALTVTAPADPAPPWTRLTADEVRAGLDSDTPGLAQWAVRSGRFLPEIRAFFAAAAPGSRPRRHAAMALGLAGCADGVDELRQMVSERDPYTPKTSRKYNQPRGVAALTILENLPPDDATTALYESVLRGDTPAEWTAEYRSGAFAALLRLGLTRPELRRRVLAALQPCLDDPDWEITARLKGTEHSYIRLDGNFRRAAAKLSEPQSGASHDRFSD